MHCCSTCQKVRESACRVSLLKALILASLSGCGEVDGSVGCPDIPRTRGHGQLLLLLAGDMAAVLPNERRKQNKNIASIFRCLNPLQGLHVISDNTPLLLSLKEVNDECRET